MPASTLKYTSVFEHLVSEDEKLIWTAKPSRIAVLDASATYILICMLLIFAFCLIPNFMGQQNYYLSLPLFLSFLGVLTLPVLLFKWIEFNGTYFAISNKRIIVRTKFLHQEISSYYYNNVQSMAFYATLFENSKNLGTIEIVFFYNQYDSEGEKFLTTVKLVAIENAEDVYKDLKSLIHAAVPS